MNHQMEALTEAVRGILAKGQSKLDKEGVPFSGMAQEVAETLWELGYRQGTKPPSPPLEYSLIRETDAGDVVLVPPRWENLDDIFEFLHYNDGMKEDMSIRYRHAELWDELEGYWWEDAFEDYQKGRVKIYEQG